MGFVTRLRGSRRLSYGSGCLGAGLIDFRSRPNPRPQTLNPDLIPLMPDTSAATAAPPTVAGKLLDHADGKIVIALPGTDYRMRLVIEIEPPVAVGQKITGTIHATARRVDVIPAGGSYVEPVAGRPRRVQGRIVGGHVPSRTLYVKAGPTLICTLSDERQNVGDFHLNQLVSFDVEPGAVFKPVLGSGV